VLGKGGVLRGVAAALVGSVLYRLAIALALSFKLGSFALTPSDLKLVTALLVVAALVAPQLKTRMRRR